VEALFSGKLFDGFLYPRKNTCQEKNAHKILPGLVYICSLKVNKQQNNASFRKHYLDLLAFSPLEILSLPTGLTHQMVVDTHEIHNENLERIFSENICPIYGKYTSSHLTQMFFWHSFREHMFLQLEEEKSLGLRISVTICASGQGQGFR